MNIKYCVFMKNTILTKVVFFIVSILSFGRLYATNNDNYIYTLLPSNKTFIPSANCIYKEKNRYIWIGTNNGIYRFDGAEYKHYHINEKSTLKHYQINGIFVDKNENLWFVSNKEVGKYNNKEDKFLVEEIPETGNADLSLYCYYKEEDGIYFGSSNRILKYDYNSQKIEVFHSFKFKTPFLIKFIVRIDKDNILISDQNNIHLFNTKSKKLKKDFIPLPSKASCFYFDEKNLWIATFNNGLKCFDIKGKELKSFEKRNSELSSEVILCIEENNNTLWMGTDGGGINLLDKKTNAIKVLEHVPGNNNSLPSNSIKSIHIDDYDMVWAGSVRDGIINIQKGLMNTYQEVNLGSPFGLSNPTIIFLFQEEKSNELWIGTDGEGINKFDFENKTFTHYPSTFKTKVASIASFSENELLLSLYLKGFFLFNKKDGSLKKFNIDNEHIINRAFFSETTVNVLNENYNNILFITDKIFRYNKKNGKIKEIKIDFEKNHFGYFLVAGKDDRNIYLFDNRAIYRLEKDSDSLIRIFNTNSEIIRAVSLDNDMCMWIATSKGLRNINVNTGKQTEITNDILKNISSLVPDNKGTIWIGIENRLYAYLQKNNSFALFGASQGAKDNEYLKKSNLLANNGDVCMGGARGLLIIDKNFKIDATEIPEVRIAEIKIDGIQQIVHNDKEKENITMAWDSKSLEVSVMSLEKDILRPKNFRFEIIGANPMVIKSSDPVLRLHSLLPGSNSIYVSCSTRKGLWTRPVELLTIEVLPPWYRTWWFILGCTIMLFIIIISTFFSILRRKNNALKMALKEHERKVYEEKVRFLINMSHELRTPLTLIHAPLKRILKNMKNDDKNFVALSKIYSQSGRMKKLLNMVLDLRKMEMGERTVHFDEYNLNEWITSVVNDFVSEGEAIGINIQTKLDKNIDKVVFDKEKMEIILTNLLVNAMKHSEKDSEVIIKSELTNENKDIMISITDKGPGLDGVEPEKLFTRFYQGSNEKYGTGIGLSYSKVLVELHNGAIGARNNADGPGATFFFSFPINLKSTDVRYDNKPYLNEILVSDNNNGIVNKKKTAEYSTANDIILIVDDSNELLEFVVEALHDKFKTILTASNGKEALNVIAQYMPNIIVSDVMMPEMDGYELCDKVKSNPDTQHIPIVLLTARDEEQSKILGYKSGADTYITKPFEIETLIEIIKGLLKNKKHTKQHYMNLSVIPEMKNMDLSNTEEVFIQKLNSIIKDNIGNPELDINFICSAIGMSRASFYNKLKSVTDISGNEYINKIRLEYAIMLIKSTNLSFTEISEKSGFTSSKYFSTLFKQYTGMTPTQFRNKVSTN